MRAAIIWAAERLEFGTTHAIAGAADWLRLFDRPSSSPDEKLAALGEILGHIADDARGGGHYPFPAAAGRWNEAEFLDAVEQEDEAAAIGLLRSALTTGLTPDDLMPILADAALAHYAGFGHSLIYVVKTIELTRRLGSEVAEPLLCLLARNLIYARREDLLPEFRDYAKWLAGWGQALPALPAAGCRGLTWDGTEIRDGRRRGMGRAPSARRDLPCAG